MTSEDQVVISPEINESQCYRCNGPNVSWSAPSPLWNEIMRGGDINAGEPFHGIICPTCFAVLAEKQGVAERWRIFAEKVNVQLKKVTGKRHSVRGGRASCGAPAARRRWRRLGSTRKRTWRRA